MTQNPLSKILDEKLEENEKTALTEQTFMYDGVLYPTMICCLETLKSINTFRARKDDVVLVAYPKTGLNWVGEILTQLEIASGKYDEDEQKRRQQIPQKLAIFYLLEFGDPEKFKRMEKLPSRRVIKTHLIPQRLPRSLFEKKTKEMEIEEIGQPFVQKDTGSPEWAGDWNRRPPRSLPILVLLRNPKDAAVSFFHFYNSLNRNCDLKTWDEFFEAFITGKVAYGSYFDHITKWNNYLDDSNVFFITYEEIKQDPVSALKKIVEFFNFSVTEEEIESIVKKTSFESMKATAEKYGKLGKALFRKGIIGDWTSVFSESQNEKMDRKFDETVAKTKLGMKLKYELYCKN